jgi:Ca2+-binding RTX toxin-like protein
MVITGTDGPDVIHVTRYGTSLATQINGSMYLTPAASVRRFIRLEALDGADRADISSSITLPADLYGGPGNDTLTGGGGSDNMIGEDGDDLLLGGPGDDSMWGLAGRDNMYGEGGWDLLDYSGAVGPGARGPVGVTLDDVANDGEFYLVAMEGDNAHSDIEDVIGTRWGDYIVGSGAQNRLVGGDGNDRIEGRGGDDRIWGGNGADRIYGGEGNDQLHGERGADQIYGEAGADLLWGDNDNDYLIPGSGQDAVWDGYGADYIDAVDGEQDAIFHTFEIPGTNQSDDVIIIDRHYPRLPENDDLVYAGPQ